MRIHRMNRYQLKQYKQMLEEIENFIMPEGLATTSELYDDLREDDPLAGLPRNSTKLAEMIYEIENADRKQRKSWIHEWHLGEGITLHESDDAMVWHIFVDVPYKASRYYWKVVPKWHLSKQQIAGILKATPWMYM